jgi:hypothetical protein
MAASIRGFKNAILAEVEAKKQPNHYGARAVQIYWPEHLYHDLAGKVWVVKRDGEHMLREDGSWE